MRHRSSTLAWLGPLVLLLSAGGVRRADAAEPAAPACKNAGVTSASSAARWRSTRTDAARSPVSPPGWRTAISAPSSSMGTRTGRGGATGNQRLSERRAQAAKDYLIARGIESERIMVFGHGEESMSRGRQDPTAGSSS